LLGRLDDDDDDELSVSVELLGDDDEVFAISENERVSKPVERPLTPYPLASASDDAFPAIEIDGRPEERGAALKLLALAPDCV